MHPRKQENLVKKFSNERAYDKIVNRDILHGYTNQHTPL
jgi:hypothetical protein